jgi:hypothetical protein
MVTSVKKDFPHQAYTQGNIRQQLATPCATVYDVIIMQIIQHHQNYSVGVLWLCKWYFYHAIVVGYDLHPLIVLF